MHDFPRQLNFYNIQYQVEDLCSLIKSNYYIIISILSLQTCMTSFASYSILLVAMDHQRFAWT